ncbi:recombinase RecT [Streptomyces sp. NBC_01591]|uniref:recombinase RecT n=1 Tax=Streptomyces sp. NBC_01591 TaxID=2975888 RepID=UPI002DD92B11|nr:recombinase RecT [Streptomyces sp. NBC_01591]WSD71893.1 recombinase RecT [Streptomyces sp. NBC_01591]
MSQISNAIAQRDEGNLVQQYRADFTQVLPSHIKPDQWVRVATGLLRRNPDLARAAQRNPGSFLAAMLDCARLGLEPGDTYHLVPMGGEITGITDYTGLVELMYRSGAISTVISQVVYAGDDFQWEPGITERPQHKANWFGDRGDMVGAYAYAVFKDGATSDVVVRSRAEIEKVRAVSKTAKSGASPWNQWPDRMWKKTVLRELAKTVPTSAEYRTLQAQAARTAQAAPVLAPLPAVPPAPQQDYDEGPIDAEFVDEP